MIWVIIIASVGGLLLLAIARALHEDPPPSGNASSADYLDAMFIGDVMPSKAENGEKPEK